MFENLTPEALQTSLLADLAARGIETREGSFAATLIAPAALELWKAYQSLNAILPAVVIDEGSGGFIDIRAEELGLTRKDGLRAAASVQLAGAAGTVVPTGTVFLTEDGLEFALQHDVTLGTGYSTGALLATQIGAAYNVEAGEIARMYRNLPGLTEWSTSAATGGVDAESDAALVARYYDTLQKPAASGNIFDYEQWALSVPGVGAVKVTPLGHGPGTVDVLIVGQDKRPLEPESGVVAQVADYIESQRPIGAAVTVRTPSAVPIHVAAVAELDPSTTAELVQAALVSNLNTYVKSVAFVSDEILYNRVVFLLLAIDGVRDYQSLTLNGGTANIHIAQDAVPVPGEVTVSGIA